MLNKIIALRNIGRFQNSAAVPNPQLAKHTFIMGANGYGKTTLCAILRSLQTQDASHITGRRTLGSAAAPAVQLLIGTKPVRFAADAWNIPPDTVLPGLAIFDGHFVAENVHSGEVVDTVHKRNLYRVIIGEEGVKLANEETALADSSRKLTAAITTSEKAVGRSLPKTMKLEAFLALGSEEAVDDKIAEQQKAVEAQREAAAIRDKAALMELRVPALPPRLLPVLGITIDNVADDAEEQLHRHVAAHGMSDEGASWIATGIEHADDTCPFCGQDIRGLPLITAFKAIFSDQYKALDQEIQTLKTAIQSSFLNAAAFSIQATALANNPLETFWGKHCRFSSDQRTLPAGLLSAMGDLGKAAIALLEQKANAPLKPLDPNDVFIAAREAYDQHVAALAPVNAAILAANEIIAAKKAEVAATDLAAAEAELTRLTNIRDRYRADVAAACSAHQDLQQQKRDTEVRKEAARTELDKHVTKVVAPYEGRINELLEAFNADFRIAGTRHAYPAGIATSSYQVVINDTHVDLGDPDTPNERPSFKNTLSAGDKTTLALSFFLAHLERDPAIASKIVVFDDPFNSQDAFRRRQTVHEIVAIARTCAQVLVLSHDATFLKSIWDKTSPSERAALQIVDQHTLGSKIMIADLERACLARTATDIDEIQAYIKTGQGSAIDIVRKLRGVLETHLRSICLDAFEQNEWLGGMIGKIRAAGEDHPAHALYGELDQINEYTSPYHHGENPAEVANQIDQRELRGMARRTLKIVNASQA